MRVPGDARRVVLDVRVERRVANFTVSPLTDPHPFVLTLRMDKPDARARRFLVAVFKTDTTSHYVRYPLVLYTPHVTVPCTATAASECRRTRSRT